MAHVVKCVFTTEYIKTGIDPALKYTYEQMGKKVPFGDFRRTWWREHCRQLDGPELCPYESRDCALAFYKAASIVVKADRPGAMFRVVARRAAMERLERKPLARETQSRTALTRIDPRPVGGPARQGNQPRSDDRLPQTAQGHPVGPMDEDGARLRRINTRPIRIGALLGGAHPGSREVLTDDRKEGPG
jgi:hypothetical protein